MLLLLLLLLLLFCLFVCFLFLFLFCLCLFVRLFVCFLFVPFVCVFVMIATATKQTRLLWTLCALLYPLSCTEQQFFFSLDLTCQGQVVSSRHCHITVGANSHLTCAVRCSGYQDCVYSVWDSNHGLCRLCPVVADENCTNTEKSKFRGYRNLGKVGNAVSPS